MKHWRRGWFDIITVCRVWMIENWEGGVKGGGRGDGGEQRGRDLIKEVWSWW